MSDIFKELVGIGDKVPCAKCALIGKQGFMKHLLSYSDTHALLQCTSCNKIDEMSMPIRDGKPIIAMVVTEWDEVISKSLDEINESLVVSTHLLEEWKTTNRVQYQRLQSAIAGWNEFENLYYMFVGGEKNLNITGEGRQYILIEADRELKAALTLAVQGHTKVAYKALRSYFELGLFGLMVMTSNSEDLFTDWFNGGHTPSFNKPGGILKTVQGNIPQMSRIEGLADWESRCKELFSILSGYTHTQGKEFSSLWLWQNKENSFDQRTWEEWVDKALEAIELIGLALVCVSPRSMMPFDVLRVEAFDAPSGLFVDYKQHQTICGMFSDAQLETAYMAAQYDQGAVDFINSVSSSRTLSDEKIRKSKKALVKALMKSDYSDKVRAIEENESFDETVKWTALFGLQKLIERDVGLGFIAKNLELIRDTDT